MLERNIGIFNEDVEGNEGYLYSTNAKLSSVVANQRQTDVTAASFDFKGCKVIDIGCGDGSYTLKLLDLKPASIIGIDPADKGIESAKKKAEGTGVEFMVCGAYELPFEDDAFDVAHIRGVLHHLNDPERALKEALRVAKHVFVIEPNGYNPILKVLEKVSPYHRRHDEQSFSSVKLDRWIRNGGGKVIRRTWVGIVPMFSPNWLVRTMKFIEPVVEKIPGFSHVVCAIYVFVAVKTKDAP